MHLQVGVKVLLENGQGKYLLLKRSETLYREIKQKWDIPGGRITPGNTLLENLAREVKEETGLHLTKEPHLLAAQDIILDEQHIVRLTYLGEAEGSVQLSAEHEEYVWLTYDEMCRLDNLDRYLHSLLRSGALSFQLL